MAKVTLDKQVFDTNIKRVKTEVQQIKFQCSDNLGETNITPFTDYVAIIQEFKNMIDNYKQLVTDDTDKIMQMGEKIVESDKAIAEGIAQSKSK